MNVEDYRKAKKEEKLDITEAKTVAFQSTIDEFGAKGRDNKLYKLDKVRAHVIQTK